MHDAARNKPSEVTMQGAHSTLSDWLVRIRAEYREMPGLSLTRRQVQRLWGLDEPTCDEVLVVLEEAHFLRRTPSDVYVIGDGVR